MNTERSHEPLLMSLNRLPAATPDPTHDARVRARCHEALVEREREPCVRASPVVRRPIETFLVGAFGLVYLVAILHDAAQLYR